MRRVRSRRRRVLFGLLGLVVVFGCVELAAIAAWWVATGVPFTWQRATAAREQARVGNLVTATTADPEVAKAERTVTQGAALHPYLGYVDDPTTVQIDEPVSSYGFLDSAPPLRKADAGHFVVGLVGGSVALQLGLYAKDELIAALARSPQLAGREVDVLRLGLGGYKQPQQLLTVQLLLALGGHFDCIINLDGYNEIALADENVPNGVPAWFPRSWGRLVEAVPSMAQQRRLGQLMVLREERAAAVATADSLWWSPLWQFVWLQRDRSLAARLGTLQGEAEHAAITPTFAATGPGTEGKSLHEARADMVQLWRRCSLELQALCAAHGIVYAHFLQPNQYVPGQKPIGAEEAKVALAEAPRNLAVAEFYASLQREGEVLRRAGVNFTDLTGIFRDHPEPLYVDTCCHLGREGNRLLAEHVAAGVRRGLDLAGVTCRELRIEPAQLRFDAPFVVTPLRVLGVDAAGTAHDLSGAGFDVRFTCTPADALELNFDGRVRALRRGAASLRVVRQGLTVDVPVEASWPDLCEAADGVAASDGSLPRVLLDDAGANAAVLGVRCVGLPTAPFRLLVAAYEPLPAVPSGDRLQGFQVQPLANEGEAVRGTVRATAPSGQPLFVRVYALAADAKTVLAASPTLAITRG